MHKASPESRNACPFETSSPMVATLQTQCHSLCDKDTGNTSCWLAKPTAYTGFYDNKSVPLKICFREMAF